MTKEKNNKKDINYFNVNMNKESTIINRAKYQDNKFMQNLNKMEFISNDIRFDLIKNSIKKNNVIEVDFKKKKK